MSRHIQIESNMSITGSNADVRIPLKPTKQKHVLALHIQQVRIQEFFCS